MPQQLSGSPADSVNQKLTQGGRNPLRHNMIQILKVVATQRLSSRPANQLIATNRKCSNCIAAQQLSDLNSLAAQDISKFDPWKFWYDRTTFLTPP